MAKRQSHTVGLSIGTSRVTCIIGEPDDVVAGHTNIVGIGEAEARGLRKGVVVNPEAAVDAIKRAVEDAERMSGLEAEEATINLAGSHIMSFNGQAIVAVSAATARSLRTTCGARLIPPARSSFRRGARSLIACRKNSSLMIKMASTIPSE